MKIHNIFKYAFNRTLHRFLLFFLTFMLCTVMFLLLLASCFTWGYAKQERLKCDRCLNGGIKKCGMLLFESGEIYNQDFLSQINGMEELMGFTSGDVYNEPIDEIEKYGEQQKELDPVFYENTGFAAWFYMYQFGTNVCHFELTEGKYPDEWELDDNERLVYLGSNFKNVIVGEKFQSKQENITYVVGGVLKKESNWIYEDIYRYNSVEDSHYTQCLDNMIVCLEPSIVSNRNSYCVKSGYNLSDVEEKLLQIAEQYGVSIKLARLEDVIKENEYQSLVILNAIRILTLIVIVTSLIVLERTQYSELINDTEYVGILYANGASTNDVTTILIIENAIKVLLAFIIAVVFGYYIMCFRWEIFQPGIDYLKTAKYVYFGYSVLPSIIIGLVIISLATFKSILWLRGKNPAELMKDYKI